MKEINLDITHKCTLKCGGCNRQDENYTIVKSEITIDEFEKILDEFDIIDMCGGQSDPIFHTKLNQLLKLCYIRKKQVRIHNAANHKKKSVYDEAFQSNLNAHWVFGIDGLPHQSHQYRKNQDGEFLFQRMLDAKKLGIDVEWQYIVFPYNEEYQLDAYKLAKDHDIRLQILETNTDVDGKNVKLEYNMSPDIRPRCLENRTNMYYAAGGNILPCCWLDSHKQQVPELYDSTLNLKINTVKEIVNSDTWKTFNNKLKTNPPEVCRKRCGINLEQDDAKMKRYFLNG